MGKLIDLTGQRFGRLTVLRRAENRRGSDGRTLVYWLCECDCGNKKKVATSKLRCGDTKSCGCYNKEHQAELHTRHGMHESRLYVTYMSMIGRCTNTRNRIYSYYGGRGISMCCEWRENFQAFYDWAMANGYSDELTIDRIDVNGNYCPENCRWATVEEQCLNRRSNVVLCFQGEKKTLKEWCDELSLPYKTIHYRIHTAKWDAHSAFTTPIWKKHR